MIGEVEMKDGTVVWITGLSGSGKTTVARAVRDQFFGQREHCILLDGDEIREVIADPNTGYDRKSRLDNAYRICRFAKLISGQGNLVIVATISLFHEIHDWNRSNFPNYFEIFLDVPLPALQRRHPEALYSVGQKAAGENVMGVDIEPEFPVYPDLIIDNTDERDDFKSFAQQIRDLINKGT
jgi:adenylylsulfate kinase-like enzyme